MIAFLMAQVSPAARPKRGRADAGARADAGERPLLLGTDPPGRLRPTQPPPDGGASVERDAGPDDVHRELQQLRARLDALEQERAHAQQVSQQLQQLTQEVQQIRQQIADAEARRQLEEKQREERQGPVTPVILSRPWARNAVDPETARSLADAFRAFEADADASVAVLWGEGGTFCAGADLKAFAAGKYDHVSPEGDGPMGPSRLLLEKPA